MRRAVPSLLAPMRRTVPLQARSMRHAGSRSLRAKPFPAYALTRYGYIPLSRAGRLAGFGQSSVPSYFDTGWASVFVAGCEAIGAYPLDVAGLLINESGFNPGAKNSIGCVGLNQICQASYSIFSSDYTVDQYTQLTVSEQLPYVFAYWQQWLDKYSISSISAADLYWLNFLPATFVPNSPSSYVISQQGDAYYSANASLDVTGSGTITKGDLQQVIENAETNNPDLFSYLEQQICLAGGCFPTTPTMIVGGLALGFVGYFAWQATR